MLFNIKITNIENALEIILLDFKKKKKKKIKNRAQLLCHFVFYSSCYHPCNHFIVTTCHTSGNKGPTKPALCGKVSNWLITVQSFLFFFFFWEIVAWPKNLIEFAWLNPFFCCFPKNTKNRRNTHQIYYGKPTLFSLTFSNCK